MKTIFSLEVEHLVENQLRTSTFRKSFELEQIPRQGDLVSIQGSFATIRPRITSVCWHLRDKTITIILEMFRPVITNELEALREDGWTTD